MLRKRLVARENEELIEFGFCTAASFISLKDYYSITYISQKSSAMSNRHPKSFVSLLQDAIGRQKLRVPGSSSNEGFRLSLSFGQQYGLQIEPARPCCHHRAFGSMRRCKITRLPSRRSEQYEWCPIQRRTVVFWTLSLLQTEGKMYLVAVQGSSRVCAMK